MIETGTLSFQSGRTFDDVFTGEFEDVFTGEFEDVFTGELGCRHPWDPGAAVAGRDFGRMGMWQRMRGWRRRARVAAARSALASFSPLHFYSFGAYAHPPLS